jgi:hypothetical protein
VAPDRVRHTAPMRSTLRAQSRCRCLPTVSFLVVGAIECPAWIIAHRQDNLRYLTLAVARIDHDELSRLSLVFSEYCFRQCPRERWADEAFHHELIVALWPLSARLGVSGQQWACVLGGLLEGRRCAQKTYQQHRARRLGREVHVVLLVRSAIDDELAGGFANRGTVRGVQVPPCVSKPAGCRNLARERGSRSGWL